MSALRAAQRKKVMNMILVFLDEAHGAGYSVEQIRSWPRKKFRISKDDVSVSFHWLPDFHSAKAFWLMQAKHWTKRILNKKGFPATQGAMAFTPWGAYAIGKRIGFPLVVKPAMNSFSRLSHFPITDWKSFFKAFWKTKLLGPHTMVEKYYAGKNYRITIIDGKISAAAERLPANVVGDGKHTIEQLIKKKNTDPRRKSGDQLDTTLCTIPIDERLIATLSKEGHTLRNIPKKNVRVFLERKVVLARGGDNYNVTNKIHPKNAKMFLEAVKLFDGNCVGIDVIMDKGIEHPWDEQVTGILELNNHPSIDLHHFPTDKKGINVARHLLDFVEKRLKNDT